MADVPDGETQEKFVDFVKRRMPPRSEGLVRLFDRTDYFSAHGPDALFIADHVYKTHNVLKYIGSSRRDGAMPSVSVSMTLAKEFLRECLTTRQMRVEIWEPETGSSGKRNHARWKLGKAASPGNLSQVEDLLFAHEDLLANAVSMAVKLQVKDGQRIVGAAFVDVQEKMIGVAQYEDDDNFGNTESLLIQLGIKECIVQEDEKRKNNDLTKLRTLAERCGVIVTERKAKEFEAGSVEQDMARLLDDTHPATLRELKHSCS